MAIGNITYNTIISLVLSYISTNCANISSYNNIPACFKSGYSLTENIPHTGGNYNPIAVTTITNTPVQQVLIATVESEMTSFLNSIGLTSDKLNNQLAGEEFYDFINDISSFCTTKLCIVSSQYSADKYLIYNPFNTSYSSLQQISGTQASKLITVTDANEILNCLITIIQENMKYVACQYSITVSS